MENQAPNTNMGAAPQNPQTSTSSMAPNVAAVLSYLFSPITGIIFFLIEKENKFVKFHAFQSILFGCTVLALSLIVVPLLGTITLGLGFIFSPVVGIASFVFWIILMVKAYNNEEYMLPILGKIAKDQVNK